MTPKHTPGPWRVLDKHPDRSCLNIGCGQGEAFNGKTYYPELAAIYSAPGDLNAWPKDNDKHRNDPERIANAHLMAAAPELLSALKACVNLIDEDVADGCYTDEFMNAQAAIKKALGQEKRDE